MNYYVCKFNLLKMIRLLDWSKLCIQKVSRDIISLVLKVLTAILDVKVFASL